MGAKAMEPGNYFARLFCIGAAAIALSALPLGLNGQQPAPASADPSGGSGVPSDAISNSVVQVFATVRYPDLRRPWTKQSPQEVSGSGMVIEGKRILTNAHVVLYSNRLQIQGHGAGDRISATVESVAPGIDLAVLKLDDETFFDAHPPLSRADQLPRNKDPVVVYGYPTGGSSLSVTKGIVSRIEFAPYNFPVSGLRIQIDAAINHGNSGGPALVGDKVIGLAFSFLNGAQNIGYIIPTEEINLFLKGVEQGGYKGKPGEFNQLQTLENPALRKYLKVPATVHGIVIQTPQVLDPSYPLRKWDLITAIGRAPVDDQGMIKLDGDLRVGLGYMIQKIAKDGKVPLRILRGGRELAVDMPVTANYHGLFQELDGSYPSYFIIGPIVFSQATSQLLAALDASRTEDDLLVYRASPFMTRRADRPAFEGEGIVFVPSPFFPSPLSKGYADPAMRVVASVNGIRVRNLLHLVEIIRDATDPFIQVTFADKHSERLVFPRAEMVASTDKILEDNGVRNQGSEDAMAAWRAKPASK
jgi:S1-C subfamily serine protease